MRASWLCAMVMTVGCLVPQGGWAANGSDGLVQALKELGVALESGHIRDLNSYASRISFERKLLKSQRMLTGDADQSVEKLLSSIKMIDISSALMSKGGPCFVGYGFDGEKCEHAARNISNDAGFEPERPPSITSFSTQGDVYREILMPFIEKTQEYVITSIVIISK